MRLGGRLAAAIEVLSDMETRHRPAADALKDWGLSHRFAGAGDRAAIGNIVYGALRRRRSAQWLVGEETSRAAAIGALILEWSMAPQAIAAAIEGDRFAPAPLTASEIEAIAARDLADAPDEIRADAPDWCVAHLKQTFGDDWVEETAALAGRPPLDMRVNTLRADQAKLATELSAAATEIAPHGLRLPPIEGSGRHPNVQAEPAFQKGLFEIQDEGSQVAAELTGARADQTVIDFCAGAGGKTLALSAAMENRGQVFAYDSEKVRLAPIFDRLKRAETRNVQVVTNLAALEDMRGNADLVLIDAPCTGSGTWRRRPDAKWRLTDRQLNVRVAEQAAILDRACAYVKPGGTLAYVTCSVFAPENEDQVGNFLEKHPDFALADHRTLWAERIGRAEPRYLDRGLLMSPARTGTDGFYFAALRKVS